MEEAIRRRRTSDAAVVRMRGRRLTAPFVDRIHGFQRRAAFIRGRLSSIRKRPDLTDGARQDLGLLLADLQQVSAAFDAATASDPHNPRVLEMRHALNRMRAQLLEVQDNPYALDPFSFRPYPAPQLDSAAG